MQEENMTETESESENTEATEAPAAQPETPAQTEKSETESVKKEEEKPAQTKPSKEVSTKLKEIIKSIETMTVLELADLVKALEERFGVTAAAPLSLAAAPAAAGAAGGEAIEEQTAFTVVLTSAGANKIGAIKAVREIVPTLGLKEAKDLVDGAPKNVLEGANKEAANEAKGKLEAAGASVELK